LSKASASISFNHRRTFFAGDCDATVKRHWTDYINLWTKGKCC